MCQLRVLLFLQGSQLINPKWTTDELLLAVQGKLTAPNSADSC